MYRGEFSLEQEAQKGPGGMTSEGCVPHPHSTMLPWHLDKCLPATPLNTSPRARGGGHEKEQPCED